MVRMKDNNVCLCGVCSRVWWMDGFGRRFRKFILVSSQSVLIHTAHSVSFLFGASKKNYISR